MPKANLAVSRWLTCVCLPICLSRITGGGDGFPLLRCGCGRGDLMDHVDARLLQGRLGELKDLVAKTDHGSEAVLWAIRLTMEATDQLLQAHLADESGTTCRHALLEAISYCRAATVAVGHAIRTPRDAVS